MERLAWLLLSAVVLKHVFCDLASCRQELCAFMGSRLSALFVRHKLVDCCVKTRKNFVSFSTSRIEVCKINHIMIEIYSSVTYTR